MFTCARRGRLFTNCRTNTLQTGRLGDRATTKQHHILNSAIWENNYYQKNVNKNHKKVIQLQYWPPPFNWPPCAGRTPNATPLDKLMLIKLKNSVGQANAKSNKTVEPHQT